LSNKIRRSEGGDKLAISNEEHRNWNQNIWTKNELVLEFERCCMCIFVDGHRVVKRIQGVMHCHPGCVEEKS
jgi:hypothetical protein